MAVITATAAAGTALTAATIAAGVGASTAIAGAGMSFSQAAKQRRVADTAAAKSDVLMKKARDQATKDQYAALNVPLDVYDRQVEQTTQQQTDLIAGLAEGDPRNLAAGVGRVGALGVDAAESTRIAKADAIYDNETMKANSRADIDQQLIGMDVGEAGRQNELAINADKARNANIRQGYSSVGKLPGALAPLVPLYSNNNSDPNAAARAAGEKALDDYQGAQGTRGQGGETPIIPVTQDELSIEEYNKVLTQANLLGMTVDDYLKLKSSTGQ